MRGPRICGVASAQGRIAGRVRSSRSQRGERWEPSRRGQLLQRKHVGTPREGGHRAGTGTLMLVHAVQTS